LHAINCTCNHGYRSACILLSRRIDHFSNIVADREFSTGCYLFTVSNSGMVFYILSLCRSRAQPATPTSVTDNLWVLILYCTRSGLATGE